MSHFLSDRSAFPPDVFDLFDAMAGGLMRGPPISPNKVMAATYATIAHRGSDTDAAVDVLEGVAGCVEMVLDGKLKLEEWEEEIGEEQAQEAWTTVAEWEWLRAAIEEEREDVFEALAGLAKMLGLSAVKAWAKDGWRYEKVDDEEEEGVDE